MMDLSTQKKNKVVLTDYNYRRDIDNRLLMAQFSTLDLAVLEEILFSPLKIQIRKIAKNIDESEENVQQVLQKLSKTGLLTFEGDSIVVDKELRKYFESEIQKFDPEFKPDMDFLQNLLKKVPIHVLPVWYAIPRTSNNIFDSLVEKYLATPQIFQRYLVDHYPMRSQIALLSGPKKGVERASLDTADPSKLGINLGDPTLSAIVSDVYRSPDFCLTAQEICDKYALSHEQFEETMLHLEFNFVCALKYKKDGENWKEVVTPLHEWKEYIAFLRNTTVKPVPDYTKVKRLRPHDYSFIQDMASILLLIKKQPIALNNKGYAELASKCEELGENKSYLEQVIRKLRLLKLADIAGDKLTPLENSQEWLEMRLESRALYLYRHPLNRICSVDLPPSLISERTLREAEKSITRVLHTGWILFDDFIKGVFNPITDHSSVVLKKVGKNWRYTLPEYNTEETAFIKAVIFEWLMEIGVTATGTYENRDCFCVTSFGQSLFG